MGNGLEGKITDQVGNRLDVNPGGPEQFLAQAAAQFIHGFVDFQILVGEQHLPGQGVAVAVQSGGRQADDAVAHGDAGTVNDIILVHNADPEAGQFVFSFGVKAGHLRGFPPHQRAAGFLTAPGDSRDNLSRLVGVEFAHGQVVKEKQRFRPLNHNIIDHHGHQVDADGVVSIQQEGNIQLCPHPVG